jgi:ribosomal protein S18 acetylase RimI-like enzyme
MAGMVAWALERVPVVTLYVDASNLAAIRLYESLGFQEKSLVRSIWFAQ